MDPKILIALTIILIVGELYMQYMTRKKRDDLVGKLSQALAKKDYKTFDELLEDPLTRKLIPAYNVAFMKLNKQILKEDKAGIDKAFNEFTMPMNKAQKEALYKRAFYYYVSAEDKSKARTYYDLLKDIKPKDEQVIDVFYDTYVLKGSKYIDLMNEQLQQTPKEEDRMPIYAMLADMYRNAGNEEKEKELEKIVSDFTDKFIAENKTE